MYSYGVPEYVIWLLHLIVGLILIYVGYMAINGRPIGQILAIVLIVGGAMAILYHSHLMFFGPNSKVGIESGKMM